MPMERRLVTIVAADVVGYSAMVAQDEEDTLARFRAIRAGIVDPAISGAGGRIIKSMGDGLLIEFASPVTALRAVMSVQAAMAAHETDQPEPRRIRFRVGINLGDVVVEGDDILGDGVNIAARLESLAPPGGICISRSVHDQLGGKVAAELTPLGPQEVKNIPRRIEVWQVAPPGGVPAPTVRPATPPGLAILPFDNISSDPDQAFLADGIVEDVTTELSRFRTLRVVARNSAFSFRGGAHDIREIGRALDVAYVVEGSVRRAGNRLRVTAQLIETDTGAHVWADRWDRTMDDLFDVQDALTEAIVTGVEPELGAHERALSRRKPTDSLTAWELCSRGFAEFVKYTDAAYAEAFELYHRAIAADPDFALPHAYLGRWYWVQIVTGRSADLAADLEAGIIHARRAVELDDRLELAQAALGVMLAMAGKEAEAAHVLRGAIAMNPNNAILHFAQTHACLFQADPDCALMERSALSAIRLSPRDPLAWGFWFNLGTARFIRSGDLGAPDVREAYETAARLPNADYMVELVLAVIALADGDPEAARPHVQRLVARHPGLTIARIPDLYSFPMWHALYYPTVAPHLPALAELGVPQA